MANFSTQHNLPGLIRPALLCMFIMALLTGCAETIVASKDNQLAIQFNELTANRKVVVVDVLDYAEELSSGLQPVLSSIVAQLRNQGWDVTPVLKTTYAREWNIAAGNVAGVVYPDAGSRNRILYDMAINPLLEKVSKDYQDSLIILPSLVLKHAKLKGQYAKWDGVKRKIHADLIYRGDTSWSGTTSGLSLQLLAFSSERYWVFTSYGGLVLPYKTVQRNNAPTSELRDDMFSSERDIQTGVTAALMPLISRQGGMNN